MLRLLPKADLSFKVGAATALLLLPFTTQAQIKLTGFSVLSATGNSIPLPSEVGKMQTKGTNPFKAMVYSRTRVFIEIPGDRSVARISRADAQAFLMGTETSWPEGQSISPIIANLQPLVVETGKRQLVMSDASGTVIGGKGRGGAAGEGVFGIHLDLTRYDVGGGEK